MTKNMLIKTHPEELVRHVAGVLHANFCHHPGCKGHHKTNYRIHYKQLGPVWTDFANDVLGAIERKGFEVTVMGSTPLDVESGTMFLTKKREKK